MAELKLPRLPLSVEIVTAARKPTNLFQQWWQKVVEMIEAQVRELAAAIAAIAAAQQAADEAALLADAAQETADTIATDLADVIAADRTAFGLSLLGLADLDALKALLAITSADLEAAIDARIAAQKGQPLGLAPLDSGGKVSSTYLPPIAMTDVFSVGSEVAQLALTADEGDVAIRTDLSKSYIHNGGTAGTMADWSELLNPTTGVTSFNGRTGAITLTDTDQITALGYTPANVAGHLGQFAATTSAQLGGVISDKTGTGALVFADSPTLSGIVTANRIALASGSVGSPSLTFTGDLTMGLYRAGAGQFYASVGGVQNAGFYANGIFMPAAMRFEFGGSGSYIQRTAGANTLDVVIGGVTLTRWTSNLINSYRPFWIPNTSAPAATAGGVTVYGIGGGLSAIGAAGTVTAIAPS